MRAVVRASLRCSGVLLVAAAAVRLDVRALEQPELELRSQHPADRGVDRRLADDAAFHRVEERRPVAVGARELDVQAGLERLNGGVRGVEREAVVVRQLADREVVGDDAAVEPPLLAEERCQELVVRGARDAVDLVVRVHHGANARVADDRLERMQVDVVQLPRRDLRRSPVPSALRSAVADEVLGRGDHAGGGVRSLETAHERDAHARDEIRVLAERLLEAAPARVAADVEHGPEALVRARRPHLRPYRVRELLDQRRLPRAREPDRLREDRRVPRHQARADLLVDDRRNPQARLLDERPLERVGELGNLLGAQPARTGDPGHLAKTVAQQHVRLRPESPLIVGQLPDPAAAELSDLLLEREPAEEVVDPLVDGACGVEVRQLLAPDLRDRHRAPSARPSRVLRQPAARPALDEAGRKGHLLDVPRGIVDEGRAPSARPRSPCARRTGRPW